MMDMHEAQYCTLSTLSQVLEGMMDFQNCKKYAQSNNSSEQQQSRATSSIQVLKEQCAGGTDNITLNSQTSSTFP
jgi:hypothetical protein